LFTAVTIAVCDDDAVVVVTAGAVVEVTEDTVLSRARVVDVVLAGGMVVVGAAVMSVEVVGSVSPSAGTNRLGSCGSDVVTLAPADRLTVGLA
jgi:hypothetical protein